MPIKNTEWIARQERSPEVNVFIMDEDRYPEPGYPSAGILILNLAPLKEDTEPLAF